MLKPYLIVGIDQSLTNTGVCIFDNRGIKPKLLSFQSFQTESTITKNLDNPKENIFYDNYYRIYKMIDNIKKHINHYANQPKDVLIVIENPIINPENSTQTIYLLGTLFTKLMADIQTQGWQVRTVYPVSHKKLVYKELNKVKIKKKSKFYEYYWEELFNNKDIDNPYNINAVNDDERDAFCLAWTGFLMLSGVILDSKSYYEEEGYESIKKIYCHNLKTNKLCAFCPFYKIDKLCLKPKERTKFLKRNKDKIDKCQKICLTY